MATINFLVTPCIERQTTPLSSVARDWIILNNVVSVPIRLYIFEVVIVVVITHFSQN